MLIEIQGGLTSRLDVLASILCSKHSKTVGLVWEPSAGIMAKFSELFENNIAFLPHSFCPRAYQPGWTLRPLEMFNKHFAADWPVLFEDTADYGEFRADSDTHPFNHFLRDLMPVKEVKELVERQITRFGPNVYGLNLRRGVGINYHSPSCVLSPTELFLDKIRRVLKNQPDAQFFITTDSYQDLDTLCVHFRNHLLFIEEYLDYPLDGGYTVQGVRRALAEWYLLGKTKAVYASKKAGFARRACRTFGVPYEELVTQDKALHKYYEDRLYQKQGGVF